MTQNRYAIIVAGGSGSRFGSQLPKQFCPLDGKPVLMHTIDRFSAAGAAVTLVLPEQHFDLWHDLCGQHAFTTPHKTVAGGASRFDSVRNGITSLNVGDDDLIAVHDGVRPLVSTALIENAYVTASRHGSAIPVLHVTDSIRQVTDDGSSKQLRRDCLRAVQTPQVFKAGLLLEAYANSSVSALFTDDASVVESRGHSLTLIDGEKSNIKITHPLDLLIAGLYLKHQS